MSRAPGKYVAGTMAPAGAALDRPAVLNYTIKHYAMKAYGGVEV
jgi:hypothetical protein